MDAGRPSGEPRIERGAEPHNSRGIDRIAVCELVGEREDPFDGLADYAEQLGAVEQLIDFVTAAQDRNAAPVLETIAADASANSTVREAAKFALAQL